MTDHANQESETDKALFQTDGAYTLEKFVEKPCLEKAQEYY